MTHCQYYTDPEGPFKVLTWRTDRFGRPSFSLEGKSRKRFLVMSDEKDTNDIRDILNRRYEAEFGREAPTQ